MLISLWVEAAGLCMGSLYLLLPRPVLAVACHLVWSFVSPIFSKLSHLGDKGHGHHTAPQILWGQKKVEGRAPWEVSCVGSGVWKSKLESNRWIVVVTLGFLTCEMGMMLQCPVNWMLVLCSSCSIAADWTNDTEGSLTLNLRSGINVSIDG